MSRRRETNDPWRDETRDYIGSEQIQLKYTNILGRGRGLRRDRSTKTFFEKLEISYVGQRVI